MTNSYVRVLCCSMSACFPVSLSIQIAHEQFVNTNHGFSFEVVHVCFVPELVSVTYEI